jgi:hypothetical protein
MTETAQTQRTTTTRKDAFTSMKWSAVDLLGVDPDRP